MEKEKFANLSNEQLEKRKKYAFILLLILIVSLVLVVSILIFNLITGEGFDNGLFVAATTCFLVFIPIYAGKKKIGEELIRRKQKG
jgi:flagellar basal body-associated protein FliL